MDYNPKKLKDLWITNLKTASIKLPKTQIMENVHYISRLAEGNLLDFGKTHRAKILLGPRQVGKTTLLDHLTAQDRRLLLTADDPKDFALLTNLKEATDLKDRFSTVIIDEAQHIPEVGLLIKKLVDTNKKGVHIYITGSSALMLASRAKESAAGRFETTQLWSLSLEELASDASWIEVKRSIETRMVFGMLPGVINEPQKARQYLLDFADSALYTDLFSLAEMRKPTDLVRLLKYLAYNIGSEIRYGSIARELGIENKTIERYVNLLESAFIVQVVPSLSRNPTKELRLSKKIYFCDNGIRNALIRDFSPLATRGDAGALWENLFFTERLKYHANRNDGAQIYFWRSNAKHEVDFLEMLDGKVSAFECKLKETKKTTSIRAYERNYPDSPVKIVTPDTIDALYEPESTPLA